MAKKKNTKKKTTKKRAVKKKVSRKKRAVKKSGARSEKSNWEPSSSFKSALKTEVKALEKEYGYSIGKAFVHWAADLTLGLQEEALLEAIGVDGPNDKGIDLFYVDDDHRRVIIAQGKFSSKFDATPRTSHIDTLTSCVHWLSAPESLKSEGRPDLISAAVDYKQAVDDGYAVDLYYIYLGRNARNIERHAAAYNNNPSNKDDGRKVVVLSAENLERTWNEFKGQEKRIAEDSISAIEDHILEVQGEFGHAYLATVTARELTKLFDKYGLEPIS